MASLANRSRLLPTRPGRIYRLEMEGRTLWFTVGLMTLTGVVIFGLGVVTGKGMRMPARLIPVVARSLEPAPSANRAGGADFTALNDGLTSPLAGVEALTITQTNRQTEDLLSRARRELTVVEVPPAQPAVQAPAAVATPAPKLPVTPAAARAVGARKYTVQVFSSRNQRNARGLMLQLKKKGFAAYLNQFQAPGKQTWYRVRVGRTSRDEAKSLAKRLKAESNLHNSQIIAL